MVDTGATQAIPADGLTVSPTSRASGDTFTTDKVRFFDEDEIHKYHERTGSLDQALQEFTHGYSKRFIIFANKPAFDGLRGSADLTSFFPSSFWRIVEDDLNGTFGIEHHGEIPGLLYDTWSTFKIKHVTQGLKLNYYWSQISVFVRQSKSKQFVLFIDCPPTVVDRIVKDVLETENPPRQFARPYHDPFIWHALLIEELRAIYDTSVWELRDVVREWEKSRREEPQVELLNEIGRHLIHGNEVLDVADDTIDSIIYQHKLFHERQTNEQQMPDVHNRVYTTVQDKLFTSKKDIKAINARAVSLYERLRHEINLAYHVAARNTTQISIDIAKIARRDNATMKALAFIGVLYLPGTFISGIFGSNFFNYNPQGGSSSSSNGGVSDWRMSDKFWIYWAITIPVTMFTVLLWIVLDDTMEMYESLVSRVRAAARHIWNQLAFGKKPNTEKTDDVNRYRAGGVNGAIWSNV